MRGANWDSRATSKSRSRRIRARSNVAGSPNIARPGVTRVSLGAQSFDERQLKLLGRIHSADETRRAAEELHAAGLSNFNLDLMYALPGQTAERSAGGSACGARADTRASFAVPPDDRARHAVRGRAARAAGRRNRRGHAGTLPAVARGSGVRAVRSVRLRARGRALRSQPQLLDLRRLPRHRRRRARQALVCRQRTSRCARSRRASRGVTWPRSRARWCAKPIRRPGSAVRVRDERLSPRRRISG